MFERFSLAAKLQLVMGVLLSVFIISGIISITNMSQMTQREKVMYEKTTLPLVYLGNIRETYQRIRVNLFKISTLGLLEKNEDITKLADRIESFKKELNTDIQLYTQTLIDDKDRELAKDLDSKFQTYFGYIPTILNLVRDNKDLEAMQLLNGDAAKAKDALVAALEDLTKAKVAVAEATYLVNEKKAEGARFLMIFILFISTLFVVIMGLLMSRNIKSIIQAFTDQMNKLIDAAIHGRLDTRADINGINFEFRSIAEGVNTTIDSLVDHIDTMPHPAFIVDTEFNIKYANKVIGDILALPKEQILGTKCYSHFKTSDCKTEKCACARAMKTGQSATSETDAHPSTHNLDISYTGTPVKNLEGKIIGAFETILDQTAIKKAMRKADKAADYQEAEVGKLIKALDYLAKGDLSFKLDVATADEDTTLIRNNFNRIAAAIKTLVDTQVMLVNAAREVAGGNLIVELEARSDNDELVIAMGKMTSSLDRALSEVAVTVGQVTSGAEQISDASQSLSQGATEQASSLEEITSSMTEIGSQTKINAENANQANTMSKVVRDSAENGRDKLREMVAAMSNISDSSSKISKIIKVIDEIAFQTNLLALNASVEAARAGRHGKGFAVVADEVRNLAGRSAKAAKETAELIESSLDKVAAGTNIAEVTSASFIEILGGIVKVTDIVGEIAAASSEQSQGIIQINQGLSQIDRVTQQNTANAEETAAAAEELSSQSMALKHLTDEFRLSGNQGRGERKFSHAGTVDKTSKPKKKMPAKGWGTGNTKPLISLDDNDFGKF